MQPLTPLLGHLSTSAFARLTCHEHLLALPETIHHRQPSRSPS